MDGSIGTGKQCAIIRKDNTDQIAFGNDPGLHAVQNPRRDGKNLNQKAMRTWSRDNLVVRFALPSLSVNAPAVAHSKNDGDCPAASRSANSFTDKQDAPASDNEATRSGSDAILPPAPMFARNSIRLKFLGPSHRGKVSFARNRK